jgi:hypothetical protein
VSPVLPFDDVRCPAFYRLANVANLIEFQVFIGGVANELSRPRTA